MVFIFDPTIISNSVSSFMYILTPDIVTRAIAVLATLFILFVSSIMFNRLMGNR